MLSSGLETTTMLSTQSLMGHSNGSTEDQNAERNVCSGVLAWLRGFEGESDSMLETMLETI